MRGIWLDYTFSLSFFLSFFLFFFFLVVLGVRRKALHLVGRYSITWATPSDLFTLVIFEIGSCFMPRLAWTVILFILPYASGMTTEPTHWLRWSPANSLPGLTLNLDPPNLCLPSSYYYRHEPLHMALITHFFVGQWFELRASHLQSRHSTSWASTLVHFALVTLEVRSHKLSAQDGLEIQSSQSQPPKKLGLQSWVTGYQLSIQF
jgi:hypothetical protein